MSDSTVDPPTGVPSRQRRNRLLLGICVLLLLAAGVWLYVDQAIRATGRQRRAMGRLLVDQAMLIEHWEQLETNKDFRAVVIELSDKLSNQEYELSFIRRQSPEGVDAPQDEFQWQVLEEFEQAGPETALDADPPESAERVVDSGSTYEYYQPIRARASCLMVCHRPLPSPLDLSKNVAIRPAALGGAGSISGGPLREGDVMAVVKVALPIR